MRSELQQMRQTGRETRRPCQRGKQPLAFQPLSHTAQIIIAISIEDDNPFSRAPVNQLLYGVATDDSGRDVCLPADNSGDVTVGDRVERVTSESCLAQQSVADVLTTSACETSESREGGREGEYTTAGSPQQRLQLSADGASQCGVGLFVKALDAHCASASDN